MNPSQLTMILNIILYVMMGLVVLKMIIGLFKGTWKGLTSLIVSGILYTIIILMNSRFTKLYYGIDLSFTNVAVQVNDVSFPLTTIGETLRNIIISLTGEYGTLSPSSSLFVYCDNLAMSIIALVVFIVHFLVVCLIVSPLISMLLYHLVVKHILGKNFVKNHKLRPVGLALNGVKALVSCSLFLMPFTGLAGNIVNQVNQFDFEIEKANALTDYTEAYQNSLLSRVFSSFKIGESSIDVNFADYLTSFDLDGSTTSLLKELQTFVNIACLGIQEGVIDLSTFTINQAAALSKNFVVGALDTIATSKLVTAILPIALTFAVNMDEIKNNVDLTQVDWNSFDWSNELEAIGDVYSLFFDTGIIESLTDINTFEYYFNRDNYTLMRQALVSIDSSNVVNEIMPYIMISLASNLNESLETTILPTEIEAYKNINISHELITIYDSMMTISDLAVYSPVGRNLTMQDFLDSTEDSSSQPVIDVVIDYILSKEAVTGVNEDGTRLHTTDGNNYNISTFSVFAGVKNSQEQTTYYGLLDSNLILDNISGVLTYVGNMEELAEFELSSAVEQIKEEITTKEEWMNEISTLLDGISLVFNNVDFPLDKIMNDSTYNLLEDEKAIEVLKDVSLLVDESKLLTIAIPTFVNNSLGDQEIAFGLKVSSFDFTVENVGQELYNILDLLPQINDLTEVLSSQDLNVIFDKEQVNFQEVGNILKTIESSKLLNPAVKEGPSNFDTVLANVFSLEGMVNAGFNVSLDTILSIDNWGAEIDNIVTAFETLQSSQTIKNAINSTNITLDDINEDEIVYIFEDLSRSIIIESTMGDLLNTYLREPLEMQNIDIDFNRVTDWESEANYFAIAIRSLKEIGDGSFDLSSISLDSLNSQDIDALESVLVSVYNLSSFNDEEGKAFADFVYTNMTSTIVDALEVQSIDQDTVKEDHYEAFTKDKYDLEIEKLGILLDDIVAKDENGESLYFTSDGHFDLSRIMHLDNKEQLVNDLLTDLNNIDFLRTVFAGSFEKVFASADFTFGSLSSDDIYYEAFIIDYNYKSNLNLLDDVSRQGEIQARQEQIDILTNIIDPIMTLNDNGNNLDDLTTMVGEINETIDTLLYTMYDSTFTNSSRKTNEDGLTFFEQTILLILDSSGLTSLSYNELYDNQESARVKMIDNIKAISDWNNEIQNICDTINSVADLVNGENKLTSFEDFASQEFLQSVEGDKIALVLENINHSSLYHDALAKIMDNLFASANLNTEKYGNLSGYTIDLKDISKEEKIALWNHDIELLFASNEENSSLFDSIKFGFDSFYSVDHETEEITLRSMDVLFNALGNLNLFENKQANIINAIFLDSGLVNRIYDSNETLSLESLQYVINNHISSEQWENEGLKVQEFISGCFNDLFDDAGMMISLSDVMNNESLFNELFNATYTYIGNDSVEFVDDSSFYSRGYLNSEILARLLNNLMNSNDDSIYETLARRNDNDISNDFITFNEMERKALNGIVNLSALLSEYNLALIDNNGYDLASSLDNIISSFEAMGSETSAPSILYYLSIEETSYNSLIASKLYEPLILTIVELTNQNIQAQVTLHPELEGKLLNFSLDIQNETFASKAQGFATQMEEIYNLIY